MVAMPRGKHGVLHFVDHDHELLQVAFVELTV